MFPFHQDHYNAPQERYLTPRDLEYLLRRQNNQERRPRYFPSSGRGSSAYNSEPERVVVYDPVYGTWGRQLPSRSVLGRRTTPLGRVSHKSAATPFYPPNPVYFAPTSRRTAQEYPVTSPYFFSFGQNDSEEGEDEDFDEDEEYDQDFGEEEQEDEEVEGEEETEQGQEEVIKEAEDPEYGRDDKETENYNDDRKSAARAISELLKLLGQPPSNSNQIEHQHSKPAVNSNKYLDNLSDNELLSLFPGLVKAPQEKKVFSNNSLKKKRSSISSTSSSKLQNKETKLNFHKESPQDDTNVDNASSSKNVEPLKVSAPQLSKNLPFSPPLNVYQFKDKYLICVALAGANLNSFNIDYHPTTSELSITGSLSSSYFNEDGALIDPSGDNEPIIKVSELRFGSFNRIVKLPSLPLIKDDSIKAKFKDGLLEIEVPIELDPEVNSIRRQPKKITLESIPDEEIEWETRNLKNANR